MTITMILAVALLAFLIYYYIGSHCLLHQHQNEWNAIKWSLIVKNTPLTDIRIAYLEYISSLPLHPLFGYCFPSFEGVDYCD